MLPVDDPLSEELRDYMSGLAWFTLQEAQIVPEARGYPYDYFSAAPNPTPGTRGDQTGILLTHGYEQTGDARFVDRARRLAWRVPEDQHPLRASELASTCASGAGCTGSRPGVAGSNPGTAQRRRQVDVVLDGAGGGAEVIVHYGPRPLGAEPGIRSGAAHVPHRSRARDERLGGAQRRRGAAARASGHGADVAHAGAATGRLALRGAGSHRTRLGRRARTAVRHGGRTGFSNGDPGWIAWTAARSAAPLTERGSHARMPTPLASTRRMPHGAASASQVAGAAGVWPDTPGTDTDDATPGWARRLPLAVAGLALAAIYAPAAWSTLVDDWNDPNYSHGVLVPARRGTRRLAAPPRRACDVFRIRPPRRALGLARAARRLRRVHSRHGRLRSFHATYVGRAGARRVARDPGRDAGLAPVRTGGGLARVRGAVAVRDFLPHFRAAAAAVGTPCRRYVDVAGCGRDALRQRVRSGRTCARGRRGLQRHPLHDGAHDAGAHRRRVAASAPVARRAAGALGVAGRHGGQSRTPRGHRALGAGHGTASRRGRAARGRGRGGIRRLARHSGVARASDAARHAPAGCGPARAGATPTWPRGCAPGRRRPCARRGLRWRCSYSPAPTVPCCARTRPCRPARRTSRPCRWHSPAMRAKTCRSTTRPSRK